MTTHTNYSGLQNQGDQPVKVWEHNPKNVAFVGDYLPRQCGIATFTSDLYQSYNSFIPESNALVISVNDTLDGYDYPSEVRYDFYQHDQDAYRKAAEFLNSKDVDVVCLQHEYGIYGWFGRELHFDIASQSDHAGGYYLPYYFERPE